MAFDKSKANCFRRDQTLQTLPVTRVDGWANGFGLHDMIGNVWEWTVDVYREDTREGQTESRVLRGGSWSFFPDICRVANRVHRWPDYRNNDSGFRVCRGSPIEPPGTAPLDTETLQR